MKRLLVLAVFVQLVSLTRAADCPQALVNGDFELVSSNGECIGWYLPSPYRRENTAGSNGSAGVVLDKLQGTASEYASQRIGLQPGSTYRFGAWVKAEEVSGSGPCFVCLGFYDAAGKWIDESWSSDVRSSTDGEWVLVEGLSKAVPTNTASGTLALCTSKSLMGRFFFDKVFCEKYLRAPVVDVYSSAYRNEAHEGDVSFAAALTPDAFGCPAKDVKAIFAVRGPDGTTFSLEGTMPFPDEARVTMPVTRLAVGKSTIVCALMNGETVIGEAQMTFERLATPSSRKVVIDRYGRAIVDGEPFFPYGMYTGSNFFEGDNFERYCEAPFNCFMEYGHPGKAELDRCAAAGIRSIQNIAAWYSMADKGTNNVAYQMRLQDHPAILGWYLFDEQATSMVPLLRDRYRYVTARDPHHPIWCAQDIFTETRHYIGACDAFGGDPYPISKRPIDRVTEAMKLETRGLMGVRPIWQVVQFFGWNWHDPQQTDQRRPTEAEVRNMTWQAIAGGARGIIYYAYSYLCNNETLAGEKSWDIWEELKRVAREVKRNERILLFAETEAIAEKDLPDGVIGRVFRENGEVWRLLVNTTEEEEHSLGLGALGVSLKRVEAGKR